MNDTDRERDVPAHSVEPTNRSVENQPGGSGRRPRDTLDREPKRDPRSGGTIPDDYDPDTMTRRDE